MTDRGAAQVLRGILLADKNNVFDWSRAFYFIQKYMPELKMFDQTLKFNFSRIELM